MSGLAETIARLAALHSTAAGTNGAKGHDRLTELEAFGSNPGALRARVYVPAKTTGSPALVVVLHGCTQTAAGYDLGSGWSEMADRFGFVLLFPEQQRQNNPNLCFNWFVPGDNRRGSGEALSIRQMVAAMVEGHGVDPTRIFVTGLSAGGAMASVMLATYPEVFSGGAVIAGLPYGSANTIPQALDRMNGRGGVDERQLAALVRGASDHQGPWPTISVWHGSADATVNPSNAGAVVDQWRALHGVAAAPTRTEVVNGYPRRVWCDDRGRELIEEYRITGMGHGTPIDTSGDDGCGRSGAYMLEASISSTTRLCHFWSLADALDRSSEIRAADQVAASPAVPTDPAEDILTRVERSRPTIEPSAVPGNVGKVIEDALRAAGLMR